jgi:proline iminopeptidase
VDQRGTGQSQPSVRASADNMQYYANVSIDMIADDYELVRTQLHIEQWLIWGGSYGSTVALTYAVRHAPRCLALILRGIYLESKREVEDIYARQSYLQNPKRLHEFDVLYQYAQETLERAHEPALEPNDAQGILKRYEQLIRQGDRNAIWHWWTFENNLMEWDPVNLRDPYKINEDDYPQAQSVAFFETRLWLHGTYEAPNHVLDHLDAVAELPFWICQGLHDEVCPYENAQRLVDALEDVAASQVTSRFVQAGHEDTDPVMAECLHQSLRDFAQYYWRE